MIKMHIGLHGQYTLFFSEFNETWIFSTNLKKKKYPKTIKFHENP